MSSSQARKERAHQEKIEREIAKETPVLDFDFGGQNGLLYHGPIIETSIATTIEHRNALIAAGRPAPEPVTCRFLIDTGADGCLIKHSFAEQAGLKLINPSTTIHGVGVDASGKTYIGRILFACPSRRHPDFMHQYAVDTEIQSGNLPTDHIDGLLGRTVLQSFEMIYNGQTGKVTLRIVGSKTAKRFPIGTPF